MNHSASSFPHHLPPLPRKPVNLTVTDPTGRIRPNAAKAMKQQSYFFITHVLLVSYKLYIKHIIKP